MYYIARITYIKIFKGILIFSLLATCSLLLAIHAHAAGLSLAINPPIIQINASPPTDIRHPIIIQNNSDTGLDLFISFRPFTSKDTLGHADFLTEGNIQLRDKAIFQKIQILDADNPVTQIHLDAHEQKELTLKIGLPKDEPPADYYFSILFLSQNTHLSDNGPAVAGGIASNVLLSIGPKEPAQGFIEKFTAPFYITNGPIPFTVILHNLSPYYISPQGQILIHNMYNQLIGTVPLLQQNILANSSRSLTDTSQIIQDRAVWPEEFLLGPYQATLTVSLSPEGPIFHRTIYFFALPLQYLVGLILLIILSVFLFLRVRKRMRQS